VSLDPWTAFPASTGRARGTGGVPWPKTTALGAESAAESPAEFAAVTWTRSLWPRSAGVNR
jgi:hypothetical protein